MDEETKAVIDEFFSCFETALTEAEKLTMLGATLLATLRCYPSCSGDGQCPICTSQRAMSRAMDASSERIQSTDPRGIKAKLEAIAAKLQRH